MINKFSQKELIKYINIDAIKTIRISIISVLIYLVIIKTQVVLDLLLIWFFSHFQIGLIMLKWFLFIVAGLISLLVLNLLYNFYLKNKRYSNSSFIELFIGVIVLFATTALINYFLGIDLSRYEQEIFRVGYLNDYNRTLGMERIIPIVALIYFLIKIKNLNKLVG